MLVAPLATYKPAPSWPVARLFVNTELVNLPPDLNHAIAPP